MNEEILINDNINYVLSTLKVEGLKPSEYVIQLCRQIQLKQINMDEAILLIKKYYEIK